MKRIAILGAFLGSLMPVLLQAQIISNNTGGLWSNPATWVGNVLPSPTDPVIIADGATVTLDQNADILSLNVGQGTSGILQFQAAGAVTLTVSSTVQIASGATLRSALTGFENGHILSIGSHLSNEGILDCKTNANQAGIRLLFTGANQALFSGNGPVTDLFRLTVDKGTNISSRLEISTAVLSFEGETVTDTLFPGFLTLVNGMCKMGGQFTMSTPLFTGTTHYTIPASAGFWMANPNFTVLGRNGTAYLEGTLIMDAGTLNVGNSTGNRLGYILGSVLEIHGGTINVASRFTATTTFGLTYTQTGGTITVNTVENPRDLYASFDIRPDDNSTFNMSGGRIVIQNANISGTGPRDYNVEANNMSITGGTLQIGNSATSTRRVYFIQGFAPNVEISHNGGADTVFMLNNFTSLDMSIGAGCRLNLHDDTTGYQYTLLGAVLDNQGTIDGHFTGSSLSISGSATQTYQGSGLIQEPLESMVINNTQPVLFTNSNAQTFVTRAITMIAGDVNLGTNVLTLGTGTGDIGTWAYTSGRFIGKFRRWINNSSTAFDFPVGVSGITRLATITYTTAPSAGGTLTSEFIPAPGGFLGLPITEGPNTILNTASDGFWRITSFDGLSDGAYTGRFEANAFNSITDYSRLVLVKRNNESSPWQLNGVHVPTTGSNALAIASRTGMNGFSDFAVGGDLIALPITLDYFRGNSTDAYNQLVWKVTCTQVPGVFMTLEHSRDGRSFGKLYDRYATAPECNQAFTYRHLNPASGIHYYRLKLTDADGRSQYSSIITLLNKTTGFELVQILPNPLQNKGWIQIASASSGFAEVRITDISGKQLTVFKASLIPGDNRIPFSANQWAKGTYQVTVITESGVRKTISFIKQ